MGGQERRRERERRERKEGRNRRIMTELKEGGKKKEKGIKIRNMEWNIRRK